MAVKGEKLVHEFSKHERNGEQIAKRHLNEWGMCLALRRLNKFVSVFFCRAKQLLFEINERPERDS